MTILGTAVICAILQRIVVDFLTKVTTRMDTKGKRSRAKKIKVEPDEELFIEKENARPKRSSKKPSVNYVDSDEEDTSSKRKIPNTKGRGRGTSKKSAKSSVILDQDDQEEISTTKKENRKIKIKKEYQNEGPDFQEPEDTGKRKKAGRKPKANNEEDKGGTVMEDVPVPKEKDRQKKSKAKKTKEAETDVIEKGNEKPKAIKGGVRKPERSRTERKEVLSEEEEPLQNVKGATEIISCEHTEQNVIPEEKDAQTPEIRTEICEQNLITSKTLKKKNVSTDKSENEPITGQFSKDSGENNDHSPELSAVITSDVLESEDLQQDAIQNNNQHDTDVLQGEIIMENEREKPKDVLEKEKHHGHVNTDCISTHKATENIVDAVSFDNSYVDNTCESSVEKGSVLNETVTLSEQATEPLNSTYVLEHNEPSEHEPKDSLNCGSEPVTNPNSENIVSFQEQGCQTTGQDSQQAQRNTGNVISDTQLLMLRKCLELTAGNKSGLALQDDDKNESNRGADVKCIVCGTRQAGVGNQQRTDVYESDEKNTQSQKQEDENCRTKEILEKMNVLQEQNTKYESLLQHITTELDVVKCNQKEATEQILSKIGDKAAEPEPQPTTVMNGDSDMVAREEVDILWEKCRTQNQTIRALHEELFTARKDQTLQSDKHKKALLCLMENKESDLGNNGLQYERCKNLTMEEICNIVLNSSSK